MNIIVGQNESLPNIRGEFLPYSANLYPSGCFTYGKSARDYDAGGRNNGNYVEFDAHNSNSTYKDNATVITKNFTYKIWTREF